jgi:thiamine biosynthesis lipoprotein
LLIPALLAALVATDVFLTEEQALHLAFPEADRIEKVLVALTQAEREKIAARIAPTEAPRTFRRWVGKKGDEVLGYAVIEDVLGKSEPITYMVAVDAALHVQRVEILAYREARGGEVRQESWRSQFQGKEPSSPLRVGTDIRNVAGATISCRSVTDGIRTQLACLAVLVPPKPARAASTLRRARPSMGTILSITVAGVPDAAAEAAVEAAFAEVDRLESILSDWRETSEVSRLNRAVGGEARAASPELLEVLQASLRWSERTGGAFDASVGPLTHLWRRAAEAELWPSAEEIEAARTRVGYRGIGIDAPRGLVRLSKAGAELDFGGIGKGYALDRAAAVLEKAGVHSALLDFGGQLLALDGPPGENAWTAGLRDPSRPAAVCATIGLVRASISTSADYERGISIDGKRASHILDPRTGKPVEGLLGASVVCPSATDADALSTALFVMGPEVGRRFSEEQELLAWLVASDGRSFETSSFRALRQEKGGAR